MVMSRAFSKVWRSVFVVAALSVVFVATPLVADDARIDEAIAGLDGLSAAMCSYSVEVHKAGKFRLSADRALIDLESRILRAKDAVGRVRVETNGTAPGNIGRDESVPNTVYGVFDGETYRNMYGRKRFTFGTVSKSPGTLRSGLDLNDFLYSYFRDDIATEYLKKHQSKGLECRELANGDLEVVTPPRLEQETGNLYRACFVLRPSQGYFPIKRASQISFAHDPDAWHEYSSIVTRELKTLDNGAVVPVKSVLKSVFSSSERAKNGEEFPVAWEYEVQFNDWRVNPEFPEDHFDFAFGPGIYVVNEITGESYRTE